MSHTARKRTLGICRQASRSTCPCAPAPSSATRTSLEESFVAEIGVEPNTRLAPAASEEPMRKSRRSSAFPSSLRSMGFRSVYLDCGNQSFRPRASGGEANRAYVEFGRQLLLVLGPALLLSGCDSSPAGSRHLSSGLFHRCRASAR